MGGRLPTVAVMPERVGLRIVVMGVAGSGKSSLGAALAGYLGCDFQEGDDLHTPANRSKMTGGRPLNEVDRRPWLAAVGEWLAACRRAGQSGVVSCSALRRGYRETLRQADPDLRFVLIHPARSILEQRLATRTGHIFPAELLQSQLDTFEPPGADEGVLTVDATLSVQDAVTRVVRQLRVRPESASD